MSAFNTTTRDSASPASNVANSTDDVTIAHGDECSSPTLGVGRKLAPTRRQQRAISGPLFSTSTTAKSVETASLLPRVSTTSLSSRAHFVYPRASQIARDEGTKQCSRARDTFGLGENDIPHSINATPGSLDADGCRSLRKCIPCSASASSAIPVVSSSIAAKPSRVFSASRSTNVPVSRDHGGRKLDSGDLCDGKLVMPEVNSSMEDSQCLRTVCDSLDALDECGLEMEVFTQCRPAIAQCSSVSSTSSTSVSCAGGSNKNFASRLANDDTNIARQPDVLTNEIISVVPCIASRAHTNHKHQLLVSSAFSDVKSSSKKRVSDFGAFDNHSVAQCDSYVPMMSQKFPGACTDLEDIAVLGKNRMRPLDLPFKAPKRSRANQSCTLTNTSTTITDTTVVSTVSSCVDTSVSQPSTSAGQYRAEYLSSSSGRQPTYSTNGCLIESTNLRVDQAGCGETRTHCDCRLGGTDFPSGCTSTKNQLKYVKCRSLASASSEASSSFVRLSAANEYSASTPSSESVQACKSVCDDSCENHFDSTVDHSPIETRSPHDNVDFKKPNCRKSINVAMAVKKSCAGDINRTTSLVDSLQVSLDNTRYRNTVERKLSSQGNFHPVEGCSDLHIKHCATQHESASGTIPHCIADCASLDTMKMPRTTNSTGASCCRVERSSLDTSVTDSHGCYVGQRRKQISSFKRVRFSDELTQKRIKLECEELTTGDASVVSFDKSNSENMSGNFRADSFELLGQSDLLTKRPSAEGQIGLSQGRATEYYDSRGGGDCAEKHCERTNEDELVLQSDTQSKAKKTRVNSPLLSSHCDDSLRGHQWSEHTPEGRERCRMAGFRTASGLSIAVPHEAITRAQSLFDGIEGFDEAACGNVVVECHDMTEDVTRKKRDSDEVNMVEMDGGDNKISGSDMQNESTAFRDNSNSSRSIRPSFLESGHKGFSTASGKRVDVSKEALEHVSHLFEDEMRAVSRDEETKSSFLIQNVKSKQPHDSIALITNTDKSDGMHTQRDSTNVSDDGVRSCVSGQEHIYSEERLPRVDVSPRSHEETVVEKRSESTHDPQSGMHTDGVEECLRRSDFSKSSLGCGFATASGKRVGVSKEAIEHARTVFNDIDEPNCGVSTSQLFGMPNDYPEGVERDLRRDSSIGENFAAVESIGITDCVDARLQDITNLPDAMLRSHSIGRELDHGHLILNRDNCSGTNSPGRGSDVLFKHSQFSVNAAVDSIGPRKPHTAVSGEAKMDNVRTFSAGFMSASGKSVVVSEEALKRVRGSIDAIDDTSQRIPSSPVLGCEPESARHFIKGFSTASGKSVDISERALASARALFDLGETALPSAEERHGCDTSDHKVDLLSSDLGGFSTASGRKVDISRKALDCARAMFTDLPDVDMTDETESRPKANQAPQMGSSGRNQVESQIGQSVDTHRTDDRKIFTKSLTPGLALEVNGKSTPLVQPAASSDSRRTLCSATSDIRSSAVSTPDCRSPAMVASTANSMVDYTAANTPLTARGVLVASRDRGSIRGASSNILGSTTQSQRASYRHTSLLSTHLRSSTEQHRQRVTNHATRSSGCVRRLLEPLPDQQDCTSAVNTDDPPADEWQCLTQSVDDRFEFTQVLAAASTSRPSSRALPPATPSSAPTSGAHGYSGNADMVSDCREGVEKETTSTVASSSTRLTTSPVIGSGRRSQRRSFRTPYKAGRGGVTVSFSGTPLSRRSQAASAATVECRTERTEREYDGRDRLLATRQAASRRYKLTEALGSSPRDYSCNELLLHGVSVEAQRVTFCSAADLRVPLHEPITVDGCFLEGAVVQVGVVEDVTAPPTVGVAEASDAILATPTVRADLVPAGWLLNAWRHVVWKLASYERKFPQQMAGRCLTVRQIVRQLMYRYDVELDRGQRPAVRRIVEGDDPAARTLVLCVVDIGRDSNGVVDSVLLSDGWYCVRAQCDTALRRLVTAGRIRVGCKLIIHGAQLSAEHQPCAPLEMGANATPLRFSVNSCRRVRWHTKLGFYRYGGGGGGGGEFCVRLYSVIGDGGAVARVDVCVGRRYPLLYCDKSGGDHASSDVRKAVFLSERQERRAARARDSARQQQLEQLLADVQRDMSGSALELHAPPTGALKATPTRQEVARLCSGQEVYECVTHAADVSSVESLLTDQQKLLLQQYQRQCAEEQQQKMEAEFRRRLDLLPAHHSSTIPLLKIRVWGTNNLPLDGAVLTIWRPSDELMRFIKEGTCLSVYGAVASAKRDGALQLSAGSYCRIRPLAVTSQHKAFHWPPRCWLDASCEGRDGVRPPPQPPAFGEVDLVALVVRVEAPPLATTGRSDRHRHQTVYMCDHQRHLVAVHFWRGLQSMALERVVCEGRILLLTNVQPIGRHLTGGALTRCHVTELTGVTAPDAECGGVSGGVSGGMSGGAAKLIERVNRLKHMLKQRDIIDSINGELDRRLTMTSSTCHAHAPSTPLAVMTAASCSVSGRGMVARLYSTSPVPAPPQHRASPHTPAHQGSTWARCGDAQNLTPRVNTVAHYRQVFSPADVRWRRLNRVGQPPPLSALPVVAPPQEAPGGRRRLGRSFHSPLLVAAPTPHVINAPACETATASQQLASDIAQSAMCTYHQLQHATGKKESACCSSPPIEPPDSENTQ